MNNFNNELRNLKSPARVRIFWAAFYIFIASLFMFGLYVAANRIRTHTLPTGQVQLSVPYSKYLVGEVVTFTLKNNYNSPVYIQNNCPNEPLAVYFLQDGTWVRQHDLASLKDCPTELRQVSIPANGVVNGTFAAWHNLFSRPGKYRVVAFVEYYNALPFQEFEVIAKSTKTVTPASNGTMQPSSQGTTQPNIPTYTEKKTKTINTAGGSITVQYDNTTIYVVSISPAAGCGHEGGNNGSQVQVTFICPGNQIQVQLSLLNGVLQIQIEPSRGGD